MSSSSPSKKNTQMSSPTFISINNDTEQAKEEEKESSNDDLQMKNTPINQMIVHRDIPNIENRLREFLKEQALRDQAMMVELKEIKETMVGILRLQRANRENIAKPKKPLIVEEFSEMLFGSEQGIHQLKNDVFCIMGKK